MIMGYGLTNVQPHLPFSAPGNILDWIYSEARVKYSYAVHLRDTGTVSLLVSLAYPLNSNIEPIM